MEVPEMSAVTAGFGDALSTALDMMAFTHDLDLATATEGIPSNIEAKQSRPKTTIDQTKLTFNNREKVSTTVQSSIKSSDEIANKQQNAPSDPNQKLTEAASVRKMNLKNASRE